MRKSFIVFIFGGFLLTLPHCGVWQGEVTDQEVSLEPVTFQNLKGWENDRLNGVLDALQETCAVYLQKNPEESLGFAGKVSDWHPVCGKISKLALDKDANKQHGESLRTFIENHFDPYQITFQGEDEGLFTGYYEPELKGALEKSDIYGYPLYRRPDNLYDIPDLGKFKPHLKGEKLSGKLVGTQLVPYEERAQIDAGALQNKGWELVWVDSPVEAFFLHIQGSGRIRLPDGEIMRVGYHAQNGHPYDAIGKFLIEEAHIPKEDMSMQRIKEWLAENPGKAKDLLHRNRSYVFFRALIGKGPIGSMGVPLTPERSMAVDRRFYPLGLAYWVNLSHPLAPKEQLQQLVVGQDTGGAIKGALRGDIFWGAGERAEKYAGHMKSNGTLYVLLPKKIRQEKGAPGDG